MGILIGYNLTGTPLGKQIIMHTWPFEPLPVDRNPLIVGQSFVNALACGPETPRNASNKTQPSSHGRPGPTDQVAQLQPQL